MSRASSTPTTGLMTLSGKRGADQGLKILPPTTREGFPASVSDDPDGTRACPVVGVVPVETGIAEVPCANDTGGAPARSGQVDAVPPAPIAEKLAPPTRGFLARLSCAFLGHLVPERVLLGMRCPRCAAPAPHLEFFHDGDGHVSTNRVVRGRV